MKEKVSAEDRVREIRRKTRKKYSAEEKVRIVLEGLRGEGSIAVLTVQRFNNVEGVLDDFLGLLSGLRWPSGVKNISS